VPPRRRPRAARGRAGPRQDDARAHARRDHPPDVLAHPVHARPDARRHRGHQRDRRDEGGGASASSSSAARSSRTSCSPTRSTAPRRRPSRRCSRRCRSSRSPSRSRRTSSRSRSSCSPRRTRSRWRAPTRCPRRSSTASSSSWSSSSPKREALHTILDRTTSRRSRGAQAGARQGRILEMRELVRRVPARAPRPGLRRARRARDAPREPGIDGESEAASCATAPRRAACRPSSSPPRSARSSRAASPSRSTTSAGRRAGAAPPHDPQLRGRGRGLVQEILKATREA
jgi:hypothetical protein